jgi:SpoIID/LytB domain protein
MKFIFRLTGIFLLLSIMFFVFTDTHAGANSNPQLISVKLKNYVGNRTELIVEVVGTYKIVGTNEVLSGKYTLKNENGLIQVYKNGQKIKSNLSLLKIEPKLYSTNNYVKIASKSYLGDFSFQIEQGYIRPINTLPLEDYLKGVVPKEVSPSWHLEALKAQTIAARTYAARYVGKVLEDTQMSQVYGGFTWYDRTNMAVDGTKGEVLTYNNKLVEAFFSSSNGGKIISNTNAWGTTRLPYLVLKNDPYDLKSAQYGNKNTSWSFSLYKKQLDPEAINLSNPDTWWNNINEKNTSFANNLVEWMYNKGLFNRRYDVKISSIDSLQIDTYFSENQLINATISFSYYLKDTHASSNPYLMENGKLKRFSTSTVIRAYDFRSIVGSTNMKSVNVTNINNTHPDMFIVNGGGWGHGIGMSQYGALVMANEGFNYKDILFFYYPNTNITKLFNDVVKITQVTSSNDYILPGDSVPISVTATGGSTLLYKFWVYDGVEWKVLRDYSTSSLFTWNPNKSGSYKISIHVKDKYSLKDYDDFYAFSLNVENLAKIKSINTDLQSPQIINSTITITAQSNNTAQHLFRFFVTDGKEWTKLKDYSGENFVKWTPDKPGSYKIVVHVKHPESMNNYDDYSLIDFQVDIEPVKITSLKSVNTEKFVVNQPVEFTTTATGGRELLYRYYLYDGEKWMLLNDYNTNNHLQWTPNKEGKYKLVVHVKDRYSTKAYDDFTFIEFTVSNQTTVTISNLISDKSSPQNQGREIIFTALASGGSNLLYKFYLYDGKNWTLLQNYQESNQYTWKPSNPGKYRIVVHVKDINSSKAYDAYKFLDYEILPISTVINQFSPNVQSPQNLGTTLTFIANASSSESVLYKFYVYDGENWLVLKDYSETNQIEYTPTKKGVHKFVVHVKSISSANRYDDYAVIPYEIK